MLKHHRICWTKSQRLGRNLPDHVDPLVRDRAILVEMYNQIVQLRELYKKAGWDHRPYEEESKRIHSRLIAVQMKLEEKDHD